MHLNTRLVWCAAAAVAAVAMIEIPVAAQPDTSATAVEVLRGTASFDAVTNVPGIAVHGKSTELEAHAQIRQTGEGLTLERLQARLPVKTLTTGLGLRDDHMRKYVFTTTSGQVPDVTFVADRADCVAPENAASTCAVSGALAIRGTSQPFTINLKVTRSGAEYRAIGDGAVTLSAYGIERPSQFGVTTADAVKLHLEFTAKTTATQVGPR